MSKDIAIFLDLDNLVIGAKQADLEFDINLVLAYIKQHTNGRIVLRKAYGDWRQNQKQLQQLTVAGFHTHSHMRLNNFTKNLADMQIVVDTMETLVDNQEFGIYVLLTGDRDFTPLVQTLRKRGKYVIGAGLKHTASRSFVNLCDEYIFYEDLLPKQELSETTVKNYLQRTLDELLAKENRVRASILKQKLVELAGEDFKKTQARKGHFRKFLEKYPDVVAIEQEGSTTYVSRPLSEVAERPLHLRYRTGLKKQHLRIIPHTQRLYILAALLLKLKKQEPVRWRELIDHIHQTFQAKGVDISKNAINGVMLAARRAELIHTQKSESLSTAFVGLNSTPEIQPKTAMMKVDEFYLQEILELPEEFVLEEAALALFDDTKFVPYLQAIMNRWQKDG
ncbi:MAG: hypothetical protein Kow0080_13840 [Candidatus Promineifilaceae bacterium]